MIGFNEPLYVLPFDHRGSFQTKLFGWTGTLSPSQTAEIASTKQVIYDGFKSALQAAVPKEKAGIRVDEQFGAAILHDAAANGYSTACSAEKSGQEEFDFEYGENFAKHRVLDEQTGTLAAEAGADVFVAGSSIFGNKAGVAAAMG